MSFTADDTQWETDQETISRLGTSLVGQWKSTLSVEDFTLWMQGSKVQSLVGGWRSHMLCSQNNKLKKKKNLDESPWIRRENTGHFLVIWWLGFSAFTAVDLGSIPGQGTKIIHKPEGTAKKKKERNNLYRAFRKIEKGRDHFCICFLTCLWLKTILMS